MNKKVVIIGGGINGLIAANFLQRGGCQVTLLERNEVVGGACAEESVTLNGQEYQYPAGATVLGLMQDFVFKESGLWEKVEFYTPSHPSVVNFTSQEEPCFISDDESALIKEVRHKWNEQGLVKEFFRDRQKIVDFLIGGYKTAQVPTLHAAYSSLGKELTNLWITGSARQLVDYYFTSEPMKVFFGMDVIESGPVSVDSNYTAFTLPLMASGTIGDGRWGFVKGGLWNLIKELGAINKELGVQIITKAQVLAVNPRELTTRYEADGSEHTIKSEYVIFCSDPLTAARILDDQKSIGLIGAKRLLGSSGKLVMLFNKPVQWKNHSGRDDFDQAFKFIVAVNTLDDLENASQAVISDVDYAPGYFEIYCEGAARRKMGESLSYDCLTIFFKNIAFDKLAKDLPGVKQAVINTVLGYIENPSDLVHSVMFSPSDLANRFYFPMGNIDHVELAEEQTFFARNYSSDPAKNFYQFGRHPNILYCGAGSYPCGSIAGTPAYMCATQLLKGQQ